MGIAIKWDITNRCFLRCRHCARSEFTSNEHDELPLEEIQRIIPKLVDGRVSSVQLLGGEPTARKDLFEILTSLMQAGIRVGYNTNGLKPVVEELRLLMQNPLFSNIVFSLEGHEPWQNDLIRGRGTFNVAIRNIAKTVELKRHLGADCIVSLNMVVGKHNYQYMAPMVDLAFKLGVDELILLQLLEEGRARTLGLGLSVEEHLRATFDLGKKYTEDKETLLRAGLRISPRFTRPLTSLFLRTVYGLDFPECVHMCLATKTFGYMNPEGELFPCDRFCPGQTFYALGGLKEEQGYSLVKNEFFDVWDRPAFHRLFQLTESDSAFNHYEPCRTCSFLRRECTPCPVLGLDGITVREPICIYMAESLKSRDGNYGTASAI